MAREIYYVYCHTNLLNNKKYIGITCKSPHQRWGNNGRNYKSSSHFYNAIQKYGWDAFQHEILFEFQNKIEAEEKERELIKWYKTYLSEYGYNMEMGGNYKGKHSISTCKKISDSKIGKPRSQETREKVSDGLKGKMVGKKNPRSKPVICLNTKTVYESMGIAARETNVDQGSISKCCSKQIKQIKGLYWMYYEEYLKGCDNGCEKK